MLALRKRVINAVHHIVRAEARAPALWRATIRAEDGDVRIVMRNVSRSGFMGISVSPIRAGCSVVLNLPFGAPVTADVRWALNGRFGCRLRGRFDRWQLVFLGCCGLANGLFTGAGLRVLLALGGLAVLAFV
ncbi:MAG: PilZ domain-containing protein [Sphingomonas sp.]